MFRNLVPMGTRRRVLLVGLALAVVAGVAVSAVTRVGRDASAQAITGGQPTDPSSTGAAEILEGGTGKLFIHVQWRRRRA